MTAFGRFLETSDSPPVPGHELPLRPRIFFLAAVFDLIEAHDGLRQPFDAAKGRKFQVNLKFSARDEMRILDLFLPRFLAVPADSMRIVDGLFLQPFQPLERAGRVLGQR